MHFSIIGSIDPICNNKSLSLTKEGLLSSYNNKLYLTDLTTKESNLLVKLDSQITNSYLIGSDLFISCTNGIFINNLRINFHRKIFHFNVLGNLLIISFHNSTYIFKYKMNKIHSPYANCKLENPLVIDYNFMNTEKTNDYLELVGNYDFVTTVSLITDKLVFGDCNGKMYFLNLQNKKILGEEISQFCIKSIEFFNNEFFILDEKNNLIKNKKIIKKDIVGISVVNDRLILAKENKLVDYESKKKIVSVKSTLIHFSKGVGLTDEHEILVNGELLVGNNDEVTDLCVVKNFLTTDKFSTNFENENFKNKKICIKPTGKDSLVIATNSGRLRILTDNTYKLFYDHSDSILSIAKNDDFLFTCSRDESLCSYYQGNLVLKITDISLLSIALLNNFLFAVGESKIYCFEIKTDKISSNFTQISFSEKNDSFLKLVETKEVSKEINCLAINNKLIAVCFDKEINTFDYKLNLISSIKLNKKVNVIALSDRFLFSGNKTLRVHSLDTLEVIHSLEINVPLVSMCLYNENVLVGDTNGWLYCIKDDKILFKKQIHKDRIWCIKQIQTEKENYIITGSADGTINYLINDTEEHKEKIEEEERQNKQLKLDLKVLKDNQNYQSLLEKMINNKLPGLEKELLNYFYINNKSLDQKILSFLKSNDINLKKMNLKYLELIDYLSNNINLKIKDSLVEGMDELFKELVRNRE